MNVASALLAYEPSDVKPGWVALLVVVLLGVATFLLWRSMNRQLRKINVPYRSDFEAARDRGNAAHEGEVGDEGPSGPAEPDDDDRSSS